MKTNRGAAMLMALGFLAVMTITVSAFLSLFHATFAYTRNQEAKQLCGHVAEAGLDKALAELLAGNSDYAGETGTPLGEGTFTVTVTHPASGTYTIVSEGKLPRGAAMVNVRVQEEVQIDSAGRLASLQWREVRKHE